MTDDAEVLSCPECRRAFTPRRSDQAYCSSDCNKAAMTREATRSRRIYRALYHWRLPPRRNVAANLAFICREIGAWIKEDRDAQRRPPPPHNHEASRGHQRGAHRA